MNKLALILSMILIFSALRAQIPSQAQCNEWISTHSSPESAAVTDQATIASIARCCVQRLDNLQAVRWYEKIADAESCKPEYLLEYGQALKSLRLYGKAKFYFQKYAQHDPVAGNHFMQSCDIAKMILDGEKAYEITPVSSNSTATEYSPWVHQGQLIFSAWTSTAQVPSWMALNFQSGQSQPMKLGKTSDGRISHLRYSPDGRWVVFATMPFVPSQRLFAETGSKIYMAEVKPSGEWSEPMAMSFCNESSAYGYPAFSASGEELFFSSNMAGGKGGWDIYVCKREGNSWSQPMNLGSTINTRGNEISPALTDQKLYFSSDWHVGLGGFDVFVSTRTAGNFGNPVSMGSPVNSPKDEIDFMWDASSQYGYFASNRIGGIGLYDLYRAKMIKEVSEPLVSAPVQPKQPAPVAPKAPESKPSTDVAKTEATQEPMYTKPMEQPAQENKPAPKQGMKEMYFIQIAALARNSSIEDYAALRSYGDLLVYDDGKLAKVRLGTFASEYEAKLVLSRVRNEGYADAFVVRQGIPQGNTNVSPSTTMRGEYKVRLATYSKVGNFNPDLVTHLGSVESYRKDDLTIMLLAGFQSLTAAKTARDAAASKGFTDAYVVVDNGGILEKVQ